MATGLEHVPFWSCPAIDVSRRFRAVQYWFETVFSRAPGSSCLSSLHATKRILALGGPGQGSASMSEHTSRASG